MSTGMQSSAVVPAKSEAMTAVQPPRSIQPIDKSSLHRICSGQVILDLAGCAKVRIDAAPIDDLPVTISQTVVWA